MKLDVNFLRHNNSPPVEAVAIPVSVQVPLLAVVEKKVSKYAWNYAKMTGLFPEFDKKQPNKSKGGGKK